MAMCEYCRRSKSHSNECPQWGSPILSDDAVIEKEKDIFNKVINPGQLRTSMRDMKKRSQAAHK